MCEAKYREAKTAVAEHGSIRKAAAALGVPHTTLQNRLKSGTLRGYELKEALRPREGHVVRQHSVTVDKDGGVIQEWAKNGIGEPDVEYAPPPQHTVIGESTLVDAHGHQIVKWVKTKKDAEAQIGLIEGLQKAFENYTPAAPIAAPTHSNDDLLTLYPLADLHFGMYAYAAEAGENYDIKIASKIARDAIGDLVAQSVPSSRAVLLGLGDYFHANDSKGVTPHSGHNLDTDGRWPRVYDTGALLACALVDLIATKHRDVEVVWLPGNHDVDAAPTLQTALRLFYSLTERVSVTRLDGVTWFREFGKCLLGATHGHTMKPERMAMCMAADMPEAWGRTKFRSMFFGHIHHESMKEIAGVRVESFNSPAAKDGWNAASGYRSGRAMNAITFHYDRGEIGRHRVEIQSAR